MPEYHKHPRPQSTRKARKLSTSSSRWRKIRACYLALHPICPCGDLATEVDHKDNNSDNNRATNLASYCKSCHSKKTYYQDGIGRFA